jgi:hypothetical protein
VKPDWEDGVKDTRVMDECEERRKQACKDQPLEPTINQMPKADERIAMQLY